MLLSRILRTGLVAIPVFFTGWAGAQMPSTLPSLEGKSTYPLGVNNAGLVVGNAYGLPGIGDSSIQALVWVNGQIVTLGGFANSTANGINDAGLVVGAGYASPESGPVPVVWKDGAVTVLPTLGGRGLARDINANGDIVGWVDTDTFTAPAVWRNGQLTVLQGLLDSGGEATAIDDDGRISGFSRGFDADNLPTEWVGDQAQALPVSFGEDYAGLLGVNKSGNGRTSGFVLQRQYLENGDSYLINVAVGWENGQFRTLQRPNGTGKSFANDVNAQGRYVGYTTDANGRFLPTVWTDEGASTLTYDSNRSAIAVGANESGTVVGVDYTDPYQPVPLVWQTEESPAITMKSVVAQRGDAVELSARMTRAGKPMANKPIVFRVAGKDIGTASTDAKGRASVSYRVPAGGAGALDVQASSVVGGGASSMRKIEIAKAGTTAGVTPSKAVRGQTVTLRGSLRSTQANRGLAGQTLRFTLDGVDIGQARTNASGVARLRYQVPAGLPVGSHPVETRFAGDATFGSNVGRASLGVVR